MAAQQLAMQQHHFEQQKMQMQGISLLTQLLFIIQP
jgi:hypothetical protein